MTGSWRGRFSARIDSKGRVKIPSGLYQGKATSKAPRFFITNNVFQGQRFLDVFPEKEWNRLESKISEMPRFHLDVQAFKRFYISSAIVVESDSQSRLLVPQDLREYAKFSEDIVIVGAISHFEIWDVKAWQKFHQSVSENFEDIVATISNLEPGKKK